MRHALTDADLYARSYSVTHPPGAVVLPGAPGWDQLLYASSGVLRVESGAQVWVVPPHRALWLPDGTRPRIVMHGRVAVRTLYLPSPDARGPAGGTVVLDVSPLLRELVLHAVRTCPLERRDDAHGRLVGMIADQLAVAPQGPLLLPQPRDPRAAALAAALTADPATAVSLERLAAAAGASRRTCERLFLAETGLTIGRWRQRLRLARALELLAAGHPVTDVAAAVGYATPSAFTAMFHTHLGAAPTRFRTRG